MQILIDGDGCPVISITISLAQSLQIPVTVVVDRNHLLTSSYATIVTVDQGADSADFALLGLTSTDDIVITQDYGVASLALSKGAYALHQNGKEYTPENIDLLLFERHLAKKQRNKKGKKHYHTTPKRTSLDDEQFIKQLRHMCQRLLDLS
ncbi:YaiI/YqxD family protein [Lachnospiraceae bacterium LCP25S3_G4]